MESRALLALGRFRREERAALAVAAEQAAFELHAVDTSDEASDWLSNHDAHGALLESEQSADIYHRVYDAERPELFFKSTAWRVVGPDAPIAVRPDSAINGTPEICSDSAW